MLTLTYSALVARLQAAGVPIWSWQFADDTYRTVSAEWVREAWAAWVDSLRTNAPEAVESRQIGGGLTRAVPRWVPEAGDCDNHALLCYAHGAMGNWLAALRGAPRTGLAYGLLFYTAAPRAENRHREGRHALLWFIDHAGDFRAFEPGDGDVCALTPAECASVSFGLAA